MCRAVFRRLLVATVFLVLGAGSVLVPASRAQDVQVPLSPDSTVYTIDPGLREATGLFPEVSGFRGAELYRVEGGGFELVIRYRVDDCTRRERRALSAADVRKLRAQVAEGLRARRDTRSFTQEGRYGLIASTTVHGLVEGGLLARATNVEGDGVGTLVLLGGATGFFAPLFATQEARVTEGEADATFYGGLQGYVHGAQTTALLGMDDDGQVTAGLAALLGAAEGTAGYLAARRNDWTGGHAEMISYTGAGGNLIGFAMGTVVAEDDGVEDENTRNRITGAASLAGSVAGIYLGHRMGRTDRYTEGDARIYFQTAAQGANLMGSVLSVGAAPGPRTTALLVSGAALGGGVLGRRLVRRRDFTATQGNLVALGSVAGSLLGVALTIESDEGSTTAVAQALGAAAGFGVTYGLLRGDARRQNSSSTSSLDLEVSVGPGLARYPSDRVGLVDRIRPRLAVTASF